MKGLLVKTGIAILKITFIVQCCHAQYSNITAINDNICNKIIEDTDSTEENVSADTLPGIKQRSFIYSLGANFDFIDNIKSDKTYHDIRYQNRRLGQSPIGLEVAITRFRTFSRPDSSNFDLYKVNAVKDDNDSLTGLDFITTNVVENYERKLDNWRISFSPSLQLNRFKRGNVNDSDLYIGIYLQLEYERSNYELTTTREFSEEITAEAPASWPRPYELTNTQPHEREVERILLDNYFYSAGIRYFNRNSIGIIEVNAGVGIGFFNLVLDSDADRNEFRNTFGYLNIVFIEPHKAGIKIGAELRAFMQKNGPSPEYSLSRFNVFLAKEISFAKIGQLFEP